MSDKDILQKAIGKAVEGGYKFPYIWKALKMADVLLGRKAWVNDIIFSHDFARAFWGEKGFPGEYTGKYPNPILNKNGSYQKGWQYHLQQMVLEEEPLKYLEKFLE